MAITSRPATPAAGALNLLVDLYDVPATTLDPYNQPSTAPGAHIGTFWADVRLLRVQERIAAQQSAFVATHMVTMRWLGDAIPTSAANPHGLIRRGMQLVLQLDGSRLTVIEANDVDKAHVMWQLTCQEQVGS